MGRVSDLLAGFFSLDERKMSMLLKKYRLSGGGVYWHKLYFAIMPRWAKKYSPPGGDYNYAYYFVRPDKYATALYYRAKWFVQRGRRGYADCDVWGLDCYLARWLPEAIRRLADGKVSHPFGMTTQGWKARLEKMALGFNAAHILGEEALDWRSRDARELQRQFDRGMRLFHEHFFSLWD